MKISITGSSKSELEKTAKALEDRSLKVGDLVTYTSRKFKVIGKLIFDPQSMKWGEVYLITDLTVIYNERKGMYIPNNIIIYYNKVEDLSKPTQEELDYRKMDKLN
jgi:hypothetical protein